MDDRVEGDRGFAETQDHRVAAGLDALGDRDLALAAEQLDRAHLAQVHAHRIVGAVDDFLLLVGLEGRRGIVLRIGGIDLVGGVVLRLGVLAAFLVLDDVDAHVAERGHDVLDLLGRELVLREHLVELIDRDVAALPGARDQLLDRALVEIDQRCVASLGCVGDVRHVRLRHQMPLEN